MVEKYSVCLFCHNEAPGFPKEVNPHPYYIYRAVQTNVAYFQIRDEKEKCLKIKLIYLCSLISVAEFF